MKPKLTETEAKTLINQHQKFIETLNRVTGKISVFTNEHPDAEECKIYFGYDDIQLEWVEDVGHMGCYDTEYHELRFPISYLWTDLDEVIKEKKDEKRKEKEEKARVKLEEQLTRKAEKERTDYKKFLELKEKYEGDGK